MTGANHDENHESRITNHGRAPAWLIGLGAFFVVAGAPLEEVYWETYGFDLIPRDPGSSFGAMPSAFGWYWSSYVLHGALLLLFIVPSLVFAFAASSPRRERVLLTAFPPLSGLLSLLAYESAYRIPFARPLITDAPFWLAWLLPAAGAAGVLGACVVGIPRSTLASWARRILAADLLWIGLLQSNRMGAFARYFPAASVGLGASMILLGEILARPRPVILDS